MEVLREGLCVHPWERPFTSNPGWAGGSSLGRQLFDSFLLCKLLTPLFYFFSPPFKILAVTPIKFLPLKSRLCRGCFPPWACEGPAPGRAPLRVGGREGGAMRSSGRQGAIGTRPRAFLRLWRLPLASRAVRERRMIDASGSQWAEGRQPRGALRLVVSRGIKGDGSALRPFFPGALVEVRSRRGLCGARAGLGLAAAPRGAEWDQEWGPGPRPGCGVGSAGPKGGGNGRVGTHLSRSPSWQVSARL